MSEIKRMKRITLLMFASIIFITGCATTEIKPCLIPESLTETVRENVRNHIKEEFGEAYAYYSNERSIDTVFYEVDENTCDVYLHPSPVCLEKGDCIHHGEYYVQFNKESLQVEEVLYIVY